MPISIFVLKKNCSPNIYFILTFLAETIHPESCIESADKLYFDVEMPKYQVGVNYLIGFIKDTF